ncbi:pentapeptide repeat-containing protein [Nodosilinea sp. AN01ver1]|uniref:pentapeptide repeat-containing protein n=1 Tax=Nodosilinea sp. AN01ver1 TaxID=3423362 RepID=UPI003D30EF88
MANEKQVALLRQGSEVWNAWRKENPGIEIDLSSVNLNFADLSSVDLSFADCHYVDFHSADLKSADLRSSDFSSADLSSANIEAADLRFANLFAANLRSADLSSANLKASNLDNSDLSNTNLKFSNFRSADLSSANLQFANLSDANLSDANLSDANLNYANLTDADLTDANLNESQVLYTNFTRATLTGACIANWQIGTSTILEHVKCDRIFCTYDDEKQQFSGCLPVDAGRTFVQGEFTQLFQVIASALETIPITFTEGIDWQAFFQSFQDLRASHRDENISIQGMERKGDAFIVRLEVEAEADKAAIETEVKQRYAHQLAALEAQYEERLRLQGAHLEDARRTIELERQRNTELTGVIGIVAQNQGSKYDMRGSSFGQFVDTAQSGSRIQSVQHIYAPEQQDLGEAAKEIQNLLNTLAETYNTTTDAGKEQLMKELCKEVEKHPKWRRALKAGGIEVISHRNKADLLGMGQKFVA